MFQAGIEIVKSGSGGASLSFSSSVTLSGTGTISVTYGTLSFATTPVWNGVRNMELVGATISGSGSLSVGETGSAQKVRVSQGTTTTFSLSSGTLTIGALGELEMYGASWYTTTTLVLQRNVVVQNGGWCG